MTAETDVVEREKHAQEEACKVLNPCMLDREESQ